MGHFRPGRGQQQVPPCRTWGAQVIDELKPQDGDVFPRSAKRSTMIAAGVTL